VGIAITGTNAAITINSGTGALGVSTDAAATTVSLATGAGAKRLHQGLNTTSSLALVAGSRLQVGHRQMVHLD